MQNYYNLLRSFAGGGKVAVVERLFGRALGNIAKKDINAYIRNAKSNGFAEYAKLLNKGMKHITGGTGRRSTFTEKDAKNLIEWHKAYGKLTGGNFSVPKTPKTPKTPKPTTPAAPAGTLSGWYSRAKNWVNNHPKTTLGTALLLGGAGVGRWLTGKTIGATQSDPDTWFSGGGDVSGGTGDFVVINGIKLPVQRGDDGFFHPVDMSGSTNVGSTSDIDSMISQANQQMAQDQIVDPAMSTGVTSGTDQSYANINDLFDDYQ